jgi:signal transduction histidine kinase
LSSAPSPFSADIFIGDSVMAQRMKNHDWAGTSLGPPEGWPQSLKMALRILLTSRFEMWLGWGDDVHFFFNDAYRPTLGQKELTALGTPLREVWSEIWPQVEPRIEDVYRRGVSTWDQSLQLILHRNDKLEETYHSFSYSPLLDDQGYIGGVFCAVTEDTSRVINERRLALLRNVASAMADARDRAGVCGQLTKALSSQPADIPFSLTFFIDGEGAAHFACSSGFDNGDGRVITALANHAEAFCSIYPPRVGDGPVVHDLTDIQADLPSGCWDIPPPAMAMLPLRGGDIQELNGFMLVGLNPYRPHDAEYLSFIELISGQVASSITRADTFEAEHRRAEALADALQLRQAAADALEQANRQLSAEVDQRNRALEQARIELKKEAADREAIQEALRQSQKMEALGQLTGGIAHDFNNLLTGIIGSLDMISRRATRAGPQDIQRYVAAATQSANRAATLTHRLLAFARRQPLDPRPTDVNDLILSLEELLRRTLSEDIRMHIFAHDDLWQTRCDPHQLENALLNLVINSRDAMAQGGQLTIAISNETLGQDSVARKVQAEPGDYICIHVKDTGEGMSQDVLEHAFEPFYTTKPQGQGTGLGLSMVYGFARQSEGYVRIESTPGRGAEVMLYLPRHYASAPCAAAEPGHASQRAVQGCTVLVVEDEQTVRELVVEVLQDFDCVTLQASDGLQGLAILNSDQHIDLLISDIGLPGLNGRQLANAARMARPDLPILLITGYAQKAALEGGFQEHNIHMMTKPFSLDDLTVRIRNML